MRKIMLSAVAAALVAGLATPAIAAKANHPRKAVQTTTSEQFRNSRNAVEQPSQSPWPYSGWSAPAGR